MQTRKFLSLFMGSVMMLSMVGCQSSSPTGSTSGGSGNTSTGDSSTEVSPSYSYGEDVTFYSDEPVTYTIMYSDHENYPYQDNWRLFSAIEEKTNVTLDLMLVGRADYDDKVSILVNTGDAPYIVPKIYDESPYVASGQVVAISEWVEYMPNYQKAVNEWEMESDLRTKLQSDGEYYVLPGMWETSGGGYSYVIRKDVFEAAGVDVVGQEGNWTYEEFYEAMKQVKEYTGADYVFSDRFEGNSTLNIAAKSYGVTAGWGISDGVKFDHDKEEFVFANTSEEFKEFVTYFNKLVTEGIYDIESFSQDDDAALAKFYKGDSYVINANYQNLADMTNMMQVDDAELYMIVQPGGPAGHIQMENSRLENGIMITQRALDELGEEEFIKMLRFVDWLWYSEEGQTLSLWGVEDETYTVDSTGKIVLDPDITYNGLNMDTATKKLNSDFGFGGGVFAYGGSYELRASKMTDGEIDYNNRIQEYRTLSPLDPPVMADAWEMEDMNLIRTPLMDYVSTMTMRFITGQSDIEAEWDEYVKQCEALGSVRYTDMCNEIFEKTKSTLGY